MKLTKADLSLSAKTLRYLLAAMEAGELAASSEDRARVEGALAVLETLESFS